MWIIDVGHPGKQFRIKNLSLVILITIFIPPPEIKIEIE
jgi:hypothetical protein